MKQCNGMKNFFQGLKTVPVHTIQDGFAVCVDAKTGKVLARVELPKKSGKELRPFEPHEVVLLKEVELSRKKKLKIGDHAWVQMNPAAQMRIFETEQSISILKDDVVEGIDFQYV